MNIQTKNFHIEIDKTPGAEGLRVSGLVSVPGGAFGAGLTQTSDETSTDLHLEIVLPPECETVPKPLVDQSVCFFVPGPLKHNSVSVYYEGELILNSSELLMNC